MESDPNGIYSNKNRFLCPPPTAIMIGNAWWTESALGRDDRRAPRVTISISGESTPQESAVEWSSTSGKPVEFNEVPPEASPFIPDDISNFQNGAQIKPPQQTYIGRAVGKQLFISDERQKKVEALVKIVAQGTEDEPERVIGVFPSKPIKVISKPSKKRQSAKNMECRFILNFCSDYADCDPSVYQPWFYRFPVPPTTCSDGFYKISLRIGFRILVQGL
jgi:recombining binding protein suppressor of hairless